MSARGTGVGFTLALAWLLAPQTAHAGTSRAILPAHLAPSAPFPRVIASELERETTAPGIVRAVYRLATVAGPLRISLAIVDPREPHLRVDTVLASDAIGGAFETLSSIALRTGAVAGINGDYFANGEPLGMVVRDGRLDHPASGRAAFAIANDGSLYVTPDGNTHVEPCEHVHPRRNRCIRTAIGGGPVLLRDGLPVDAGEPFGRLAADRATRIPVSALATLAGGTFALIVIDGRRPATSIGVRRSELVAALRALGARDAMLLDGGGSSTLVARVLGDDGATVVTTPSDGVERPLADALVITSHAPLGPPARLVVRPARIAALPGVRIPLTSRIVDAVGHALGDARGAWRLDAPADVATLGEDGVLRAGRRYGAYALHLSRNGVAARVPLRIVDRVARLAIGPEHANPSPGQLFPLTLDGFDASGNHVDVGGRALWSARGARIDADGRLTVGGADAVVTARTPGATATAIIPVGQHDVSVPLARAPAAPWQFSTYPHGGTGDVDVAGGELRLRYDFTRGGLGAYARAVPPLALGMPLALACDVDGDASGAALRVTFVDRYDARENVTLSPALDVTGRRRLSGTIAPVLAPPVALELFYVVATLVQPPLRVRGGIAVSNCTATVAGVPPGRI